MNTPLDERSPVYRSFEDLEVYKAMREFRKAMYRVAKRLPDIEKVGLAIPNPTRRSLAYE